MPAPADSKHTLHRAHMLGLQTTANVSGIETFPLALAASNSEANAANEAVVWKPLKWDLDAFPSISCITVFASLWCHLTKRTAQKAGCGGLNKGSNRLTDLKARSSERDLNFKGLGVWPVGGSTILGWSLRVHAKPRVSLFLLYAARMEYSSYSSSTMSACVLPARMIGTLHCEHAPVKPVIMVSLHSKRTLEY